MAELSVKRKNGQIWSHIRQIWLNETPEETVRQEYLCTLVNEYGYEVEQIGEELKVTGRGSAGARADFVIWRSAEDKRQNKSPLIVVECKSDNVTIVDRDYHQGDNYARLCNAPFFVTHNSRETKYWKVVHENMPKSLREIENIPDATATDKEIEELVDRLKEFREDEFAEVLHDCHNIIRNREKKDPAAAFDEIAKILFVKVWVERELRAKKRRKNIFTVEFLEEQIGDNPLDDLFTKTKAAYKADQLFADDDHLNLKPATGREIVRKLERYNLSATSEDIKGIAFERFLGRTFRGEIGQFFTPRTIVDFMIRMVDPQEGETICDPASGSGGFLIRAFEVVREKILADADREYQEFKANVENSRKSAAAKAELLRDKFAEVRKTIDPSKKGSRLWTLANRCIYGSDANDRMARTSKMNMIMHGDGHGGVYHRDGFLNIGGIFEERFDIVVTNPPFGQKVEPTDVVEAGDVTAMEQSLDDMLKVYGKAYEQSLERMRAAVGKPITSLFELPKHADQKIKTELLFIERCLSILKPGGRLAIVLPEGVFNNSSLGYVRDFCEARAFVQAVVSLPEETFGSSDADVKASVLFLRKFTKEEAFEFRAVYEKTLAEVKSVVDAAHAQTTTRLESDLKAARKEEKQKAIGKAEKALRDHLHSLEAEILTRTKQLHRERMTYPVFLYDANNVGITATGAPDVNELYPNENQPRGVKVTCLEHYHRFLKSPKAYLKAAKR